MTVRGSAKREARSFSSTILYMDVIRDGAPTTGDWVLDVLTTALGLHVFIDPAAVVELTGYWVAVHVHQPYRPAAHKSFGDLLRLIATETAGCDLSLWAVPHQPSYDAPREDWTAVKFFLVHSELAVLELAIYRSLASLHHAYITFTT